MKSSRCSTVSGLLALLGILFLTTGCPGMFVVDEEEPVDDGEQVNQEIEEWVGSTNIKFPEGAFRGGYTFDYERPADLDEVVDLMAGVEVLVEPTEGVEWIDALHLELTSKDGEELRLLQPIEFRIRANRFPEDIDLETAPLTSGYDEDLDTFYLVRDDYKYQDDGEGDVSADDPAPTDDPADGETTGLQRVRVLVALVGSGNSLIGVPFTTVAYKKGPNVFFTIAPAQVREGVLPANTRIIWSVFVIPDGQDVVVNDVKIDDLTGNSDGKENHTPTVENISAQRVKEGERLDIFVIADDSDTRDRLTYSSEGELPKFMVLKNDNLVVKPGYDVVAGGETEKIFTLTLVVADNGLPPKKVKVTFDVAVENVDQPPQLVIASDKPFPAQCREGEELHYAFKATDPDGDPVVYGLGALPYFKPSFGTDGKPVLDESGDVVQVPAASIDQTTGEFVFSCVNSIVPGYKQSLDVTLEVYAANTVEQLFAGTPSRFTLNVLNVNQPPALSLVLDEGTPEAIATAYATTKTLKVNENDRLLFTLDAQDIDGDLVTKRQWRIEPMWPEECVHNGDWTLNLPEGAEEFLPREQYQLLANNGEPVISFDERSGLMSVFFPICLVKGELKLDEVFKFTLVASAMDQYNTMSPELRIPVEVKNTVIAPFLANNFQKEYQANEGGWWHQLFQNRPCQNGTCGLQLGFGGQIVAVEDRGYNLVLNTIHTVDESGDVLDDVTATYYKPKDQANSLLWLQKGPFADNMPVAGTTDQNKGNDWNLRWAIPYNTTVPGLVKHYRLSFTASDPKIPSTDARYAATSLPFSFDVVVSNSNQNPYYLVDQGTTLPQGFFNTVEGERKVVYLDQLFGDPDGDTLLFKLDQTSTTYSNDPLKPGDNRFLEKPAIDQSGDRSVLTFIPSYDITAPQGGQGGVSIRVEATDGSLGTGYRDLWFPVQNTMRRLSLKQSQVKVTVYERGFWDQGCDFGRYSCGSFTLNFSNYLDNPDNDLLLVDPVFDPSADTNPLTPQKNATELLQPGPQFAWNDLPQSLVDRDGATFTFQYKVYQNSYQAEADKQLLTFEVEVRNANQGPAFAQFDPLQIQEGVPVEINLDTVFTDPDEDTLFFKLGTDQPWSTNFLVKPIIDNNLMTFTTKYDLAWRDWTNPDNLNNGSTCVRLEASDGLINSGMWDLCFNVADTVRPITLKRTDLPLTAYEWTPAGVPNCTANCGGFNIDLSTYINNVDGDGYLVSGTWTPEGGQAQALGTTESQGPYPTPVLKFEHDLITDRITKAWLNWNPIAATTVNGPGFAAFTAELLIGQSMYPAVEPLAFTVNVTVNNANQTPYRTAVDRWTNPALFQAQEGSEKRINLSQLFADGDNDFLSYRIDAMSVTSSQYSSVPAILPEGGVTYAVFTPSYTVSQDPNYDNEICFNIEASDGIVGSGYHGLCFPVDHVVRKVTLKRTQVILTALEQDGFDTRCNTVSWVNPTTINYFCGTIDIDFNNFIDNPDGDAVMVEAVYDPNEDFDPFTPQKNAAELLQNFGSWRFAWNPITRTTVGTEGATYTFSYLVSQTSELYTGETSQLDFVVTVKNVNQAPYRNNVSSGTNLSLFQATEGSAFAIDLNALFDDADNDNLAFAIDANTVDAGKYLFQPTLAAENGTTNLKFTPNYTVSNNPDWDEQVCLSIEGRDALVGSGYHSLCFPVDHVVRQITLKRSSVNFVALEQSGNDARCAYPKNWTNPAVVNYFCGSFELFFNEFINNPDGDVLLISPIFDPEADHDPQTPQPDSDDLLVSPWPGDYRFAWNPISQATVGPTGMTYTLSYQVEQADPLYTGETSQLDFLVTVQNVNTAPYRNAVSRWSQPVLFQATEGTAFSVDLNALYDDADNDGLTFLLDQNTVDAGKYQVLPTLTAENGTTNLKFTPNYTVSSDPNNDAEVCLSIEARDAQVGSGYHSLCFPVDHVVRQVTLKRSTVNFVALEQNGNDYRCGLSKNWTNPAVINYFCGSFEIFFNEFLNNPDGDAVLINPVFDPEADHDPQTPQPDADDLFYVPWYGDYRLLWNPISQTTVGPAGTTYTFSYLVEQADPLYTGQGQQLDFSVTVQNVNQSPFRNALTRWNQPLMFQAKEGDAFSIDLNALYDDADNDSLTFLLDTYSIDQGKFTGLPALRSADGTTYLDFTPNYTVSGDPNNDNEVCLSVEARDAVVGSGYHGLCFPVDHTVRQISANRAQVLITAYEQGGWDNRCNNVNWSNPTTINYFCGGISYVDFNNFILNPDGDFLTVTPVSVPGEDIDPQTPQPNSTELYYPQWGYNYFHWATVSLATVARAGGTFTFSYDLTQADPAFSGQTTRLDFVVTVQNVNQAPIANFDLGGRWIAINENAAQSLNFNTALFRTAAPDLLVPCSEPAVGCKTLLTDPDDPATLNVLLNENYTYDPYYYGTGATPAVTSNVLTFTPGYEVASPGNPVGGQYVYLKARDELSAEITAQLNFRVQQVNRAPILNAGYNADTARQTAYEQNHPTCTQNCGYAQRLLIGGGDNVVVNPDGLALVVNDCDRRLDANCVFFHANDPLSGFVPDADQGGGTGDFDLFQLYYGTQNTLELNWSEIRRSVLTSSASPKDFTFPISVAYDPDNDPGTANNVFVGATSTKVRVYNSPTQPVQYSNASLAVTEGQGQFTFSLLDWVSDDEGPTAFTAFSYLNDSANINDSVASGQTVFTVANDGTVTLDPGSNLVTGNSQFWVGFRARDNTNLYLDFSILFDVTNSAVDPTPAYTDLQIVDQLSSTSSYHRNIRQLFNDPDNKICMWLDPVVTPIGDAPASALFVGGWWNDPYFEASDIADDASGDYAVTFAFRYLNNGVCDGSLTVDLDVQVSVSGQNLPPVVSMGFFESYCYWEGSSWRCEDHASWYGTPAVTELEEYSYSLYDASKVGNDQNAFFDPNGDTLVYSCVDYAPEWNPTRWIDCANVEFDGTTLLVVPPLNATSYDVEEKCVRLRTTDPFGLNSLDVADVCFDVRNRNAQPVVALPNVLHVAPAAINSLNLDTAITDPEYDNRLVAFADGYTPPSWITLQKYGTSQSTCYAGNDYWYPCYLQLAPAADRPLGSTAEVQLKITDTRWGYDAQNNWVELTLHTVKRTVKVSVERGVAVVPISNGFATVTTGNGLVTGLSEVPPRAVAYRDGFGTMVAAAQDGIYRLSTTTPAATKVVDEQGVIDAAFDDQGKLVYLTDTGTLTRVDTKGATPAENVETVLFSDTTYAGLGLALGPNGHLFASFDVSGDARIVEFEPQFGIELGEVDLASDLPLDLAFSGSGRLYVAMSSGAVYELPLDTVGSLDTDNPPLEVAQLGEVYSDRTQGDMVFDYANNLYVLGSSILSLGNVDEAAEPSTVIEAGDLPGAGVVRPTGVIVSKNIASGVGLAVYIAGETGTISRFTYNRKPYFRLPTTLTYDVNKGGTLTVDLRGRDYEATSSASGLTLGSVDLPDFMTLAQGADTLYNAKMEAPGVLTITPYYDDLGTYTVTVTAAETAGGSSALTGSIELTINVVDTNLAPFFPEFGPWTVLTNTSAYGGNVMMQPAWDLVDLEDSDMYEWGDITNLCVSGDCLTYTLGTMTWWMYEIDPFTGQNVVGMGYSSEQFYAGTQVFSFQVTDAWWPYATRSKDLTIEVLPRAPYNNVGVVRVDRISAFGHTNLGELAGGYPYSGNYTSGVVAPDPETIDDPLWAGPEITGLQVMLRNISNGAVSVTDLQFTFTEYGTSTPVTGISVLDPTTWVPWTFDSPITLPGAYEPYIGAPVGLQVDLDLAPDVLRGKFVTIDVQLTVDDPNALVTETFAKGLIYIE